jgi:hypothetical protein
MAIVGVVLAVGTQVWEWIKSIEDDRAARQHNKELLERLDKEAHEIKRAVTRFQTISFDWQYSFDSRNEVFGPYLRDLAAFAVTYPWSDAEKSDQGIHPVEWDRGKVSAFRFDAASPAMPDEGRYPLLRQYILEAVPQVFLFKTPISPTHFHPRFPSSAFFVKVFQEDPFRPDLVLTLSLGEVYITFYTREEITIQHSDMDASVSYTSGAIVSLEDLGGCQAIICLPSQKPQNGFQEVWNKGRLPTLTCRINDQVMPVGNLGSAKAFGGDLIYTFTFPTPSPAKVNH